MKTAIAVAEGDGIGPEIMAATLHILEAAGAQLEIHKVQIGEEVYKKGQRAGIAPETWDVIRNTKAFLKAPITTPQGGGFKSLNVTIRTTMGLYANVRPCVAYAPFVETKYPGMDLVLIRENEEDLYTGIEYRQSANTYQALKLITRPGCEKIIRYAFEYARANHRKKVTCFSKDNILKFSDGLFHKIFDEIAPEYPEIENEHWIIDIGAAKMADTPTAFDVIVTANLYGDILSDIAAQIAGSVGLAGSANIGQHGAMFEAIHGSAPRRAGQNVANPSGLLMGAVLMLAHIGQPKIAELVHNAWLATLEEGIHTYDIFEDGVSKQKVGTREFGDAVVQRLGKKPLTLKPAVYSEMPTKQLAQKDKLLSHASKTPVGVDVFIDSHDGVEEVRKRMERLGNGDLEMKMIGNRGVKVWPGTMPETSCGDIWRCRFINKGGHATHGQIASLVQRAADAGIDFVQTAVLYDFDGKPGYTVAQEEQ